MGESTGKTALRFWRHAGNEDGLELGETQGILVTQSLRSISCLKQVSTDGMVNRGVLGVFAL